MTRLTRALGYVVFALLWLGLIAVMIDYDVSRDMERWTQGMVSPRVSDGD